MILILLGITAFFFSTMEVVSKPLMERLDPLLLTFLRFLIGGAFLLAFSRARPPASILWKLALIGAVNSVVSMGILQIAVSLGSASEAATLVACNPVFVTLLAPFLLKEKLTPRKIASVLIGVLGVLTLGFGKLSGGLPFLFGIVAAFTFAFYTILLKPYSKRLGSLTATAYSSFLSIVFYLPVLLFSKVEMATILWPSDFFRLIYLSLGTTGIAYVTFFKASEIVGIVKASTVFFAKPAISMVSAALLLGERPTVFSILGSVMITLALILNYSHLGSE
ncbi:MAG: EamA family transporter [Thermotogae bacterium]|nr:MAG: EamA family transporter [Thermotogota bacterium]